MDLDNLASLDYFFPEMILTGTILLVILLDIGMKNKRVLAIFSIAGCLASLGATLALYGVPGGFLFHRMMALDRYSLFFKIIELSATMLVLWMSLASREVATLHQGEYATI